MRPESAPCPPLPQAPTFRAKELSVSDLLWFRKYRASQLNVLSQAVLRWVPELREKGKGIISLTATAVGLDRAGLWSLQSPLRAEARRHTVQHRGRRRWVHGALAQ